MTQKYKRLLISADLLFRMFEDGPHRAYTVIDQAIPADAQLVSVRRGWPDVIELLMSSETFEEVPLGQEIHLLTPTVRSEQ